MRTPTTLLLSAMALFAAAQQCTVTEYPLGAGIYSFWERADVYPDGGVIAVETVGDVFGDVLLTRLDPAGNTIWNKMLAPTNPTVTLEQPNQVLAMPDGGATVFGQTTLRPLGQLNGFHNLYGIRVDAQGEVLWARYFMYHGTILSGMQQYTRMTALASNEVLVAIPRETGLNLVRLGQDGMPVWERFYDLNIPVSDNRIGGVVIDDFGGMVVGGLMNYTPFLLRADQAGNVAWMRHFDDVTTDIKDVRLTSDDQLIIVNDNHIMHRELDGTLIWRKHYSSFYGWTIRELPTGNFLATSGGITNHLEIDAAGAVVAAWTNSILPLIGVAGNEILFARGFFDLGEATPVLARAWPTDNLGCFSDAGTSNASVSTDPPLLNTTVTVMDDTLRTWTMSLVQPIEYDQLDLEVMLGGFPPRPGFQHRYSGLVRNNRGLASGALETTLTYDPMLAFISGIPAPTSVTANTVTWSGQAAMQGLSTRQFIADFQIPVAAVVGEPLIASFAVAQDTAEVSLANNTTTLDQIIVSSFDPNDKLVFPQDLYYLDSDSILLYTIRFQNTGTASAINVAISDSLPPEVHASSFVAGPSSHPYTYSLSGDGRLNFLFANINLPDSNANEPASHGFVTFRIKPDETLLPGTEIRNNADIFFDFNDPVRTEDAVVVLTISTAAPSLKAGRLQAYPVPARDALTVVLPPELVARSVVIRSADGRGVLSKALPATIGTLSVPLTGLAPGTYHLTVRNAEGQGAVVRFVKE